MALSAGIPTLVSPESDTPSDRLSLPEDLPETTVASPIIPTDLLDPPTAAGNMVESPEHIDETTAADTIVDTVPDPSRSDGLATEIPWSAESGRDSLFVQPAIRSRKDFTFGDGSSVKWQPKTQKGILYHPVPAGENERQVKELFPQPPRTEVVSLFPFPSFFIQVLKYFRRQSAVVSVAALFIKPQSGSVSSLSVLARKTPLSVASCAWMINRSAHGDPKKKKLRRLMQ